MKLRFGVGSKQGRKNGDIEALADAMRALKNRFRIKLIFFSSSNLILTACVACKNQFRNQVDFLIF
jgi:hypothetical protein